MKTVIELGREAGYYFYDLTETHGVKTVETDEADTWAQLERFAELVRADEREAYETACDSVYHQHIGPQFGEVRYGIAACKAAIKARSNT